ncbi:Fe(3+)-hydroxamate ABC transporter permease FhuB [Rhizobium sp. CFBP 8762]|uniref:Fe(3+)-hydroxamate ABC transporter permease FhuB n=1 Tax=Rhizobium sp. CFBP 8762 TaxID=2775279 RepID=UPI0017816343|nr:Fe(3+)-hydroxamate ABC transporter permease FhuB [Rhizobium sp. CFBP 8762]MBD8554993.1 Fe(3+)-hydroxamate ABC transporter permease FhuB [Rhizobium sp. CFBP 8762]
MSDAGPGGPAGNRALLLAVLLIAAGCALFVLNLRFANVSPTDWKVLLDPDAMNIDEVAVHFSLMPRFVVAVLSGSILGLSSTILQQVMRNPLAEPGTLGIFSGARAGVAVAMLWLPASLVFGFTLPALLGGALAIALVLALSARRSFSPLYLVLNGLVLSLCLDALTTMLILAHFEELGELLAWQAGSLAQDNWHIALMLLPCLIAAWVSAFWLCRGLTLLGLEEGSARGLGISPARLRAFALLVAVVPAVFVVAELGVVGFVGLAGAGLSQACGARRFKDRLLSAPLISAGLLLVTDQALQAFGRVIEIPAGAVTAILGAPMLIWLLNRMRSTPAGHRQPHLLVPLRSPRTGLLAVTCALAIVSLAAISIGRLPDGWHIATGTNWVELLQWRLARTAAAASAGAMLAMAGCLMQRMTGNPLASPELLGVSSGAALLMIPVVFLLPPLGRTQTMLLATLGCLLFLAFTIRMARRSAFMTEKLLLNGVAVTALAGSVISISVLFGDIRVTRVLGWMSGSTYSVRDKDAVVAIGALLVFLTLLPSTRRWLAIVPLGASAAISVGVPPAKARLTMLIMTAGLTGTATMIVGPLSFAGLIAPHLARLLGLRKPVTQLAGAALIGATLLILSDWIGRNIAFPWEVPAGLVSMIIGAGFYGLLMVRR